MKINPKITMILAACFILAVLAAGCTSTPAENNTTVNNSTNNTTATGLDPFNSDKGWDTIQKFLNNLYGYSWEWRGLRDWDVGGMYHVYDFNISGTNHVLWMAHDYTIIKITIGGTCYLSQVDYMYAYNDWESGKTTKKPNINDYPNYADAVNGKKTYDQIDKEFYGS